MSRKGRAVHKKSKDHLKSSSSHDAYAYDDTPRSFKNVMKMRHAIEHGKGIKRATEDTSEAPEWYTKKRKLDYLVDTKSDLVPLIPEPDEEGDEYVAEMQNREIQSKDKSAGSKTAKSETSNKKKKNKQKLKKSKRKREHSPDPFAHLQPAAPKFGDYVQEPPRITAKIKKGGTAADIPKKHSMATRVALGKERDEIVKRYRELMAERRGDQSKD